MTMGWKNICALALDDSNSDHGYCVQDGLLLRRWSPYADKDVADQVMQVVMPEKFRDVAVQTGAQGNVWSLRGKENLQPIIAAFLLGRG